MYSFKYKTVEVLHIYFLIISPPINGSLYIISQQIVGAITKDANVYSFDMEVWGFQLNIACVENLEPSPLVFGLKGEQ